MTALIATLAIVLVAVCVFAWLRASAERADDERARRNAYIADRMEELRAVNGPAVGKIKPPEAYGKAGERSGKLRATEYDWTMQ